MDGSLYAKQGTSYPTRIILINGRRKFDLENKVYPPVEKNARAETVKDYYELYKRISDDILRNKQQPDGVLDKQARESGRIHPDMDVRRPSEEGVRGAGRDERRGHETSMGEHQLGNERPSDASASELGEDQNANGEPALGLRGGDSERDGGRDLSTGQNSGRADGAIGGERNGKGVQRTGEQSAGVHGTGNEHSGLPSGDSTSGGRSRGTTNVVSLKTEKVKYQPHSSSYSIGAVVPARQKEALDTVLKKLGDADQYLVITTRKICMLILQQSRLMQ